VAFEIFSKFQSIPKTFGFQDDLFYLQKRTDLILLGQADGLFFLFLYKVIKNDNFKNILEDIML